MLAFMLFGNLVNSLLTNCKFQRPSFLSSHPCAVVAEFKSAGIDQGEGAKEGEAGRYFGTCLWCLPLHNTARGKEAAVRVSCHQHSTGSRVAGLRQATKICAINRQMP